MFVRTKASPASEVLKKEDKMIRLLLGTLVAWLIVSCAMEKQESSEALSVDPNSEIEVPEWVTAGQLDLNRDGTIDIRDLVIMSIVSILPQCDRSVDLSVT